MIIELTESQVNELRRMLEGAQGPVDVNVRGSISEDDVHWIVNDLGELGVEINGRCFFLYKGDSLEYGKHADTSKEGVCLHDDGTPMLYRMVGKREFGETCWPLKWVIAGRREDRYTEQLVFHPGLSFGKPNDGDWKPLPAAHNNQLTDLLEGRSNRGNPIEVGVGAANMMDGVLSVTTYENLVKFWQDGFLELTIYMAQMSEYGELALQAYDEQDFPGVYAYEVCYPFGQWLAMEILNDRIPDTAAGQTKMDELIKDFFAQGTRTNEALKTRKILEGVFMFGEDIPTCPKCGHRSRSLLSKPRKTSDGLRDTHLCDICNIQFEVEVEVERTTMEEALLCSIEKWRKIVEEGGEDQGDLNCPLCEQYLEDGCEECPVAQVTKRPDCNNTPYIDWARAGGKLAGRIIRVNAAFRDEARKAAVAELQFLRDIYTKRFGPLP